MTSDRSSIISNRFCASNSARRSSGWISLSSFMQAKLLETVPRPTIIFTTHCYWVPSALVMGNDILYYAHAVL